jgi:hypothetical protein
MNAESVRSDLTLALRARTAGSPPLYAVESGLGGEVYL